MSNAGRKPLPDNLHVINGNPGKRGKGKDQQKIEIEVPPCPAWLPKEAKTEWRYIVKELKRYGLITRLDKNVLATHCDAVATYKLATLKLNEKTDGKGFTSCTPNGMAIQSVWLQIKNKAFEQIKSTAPEFGLTPSARARVKVENPNQKDFFSEW